MGQSKISERRLVLFWIGILIISIPAFLISVAPLADPGPLQNLIVQFLNWFSFFGVIILGIAVITYSGAKQYHIGIGIGVAMSIPARAAITAYSASALELPANYSLISIPVSVYIIVAVVGMVMYYVGYFGGSLVSHLKRTNR
jgi:hypothetical protein